MCIKDPRAKTPNNHALTKIATQCFILSQVLTPGSPLRYYRKKLDNKSVFNPNKKNY